MSKVGSGPNLSSEPSFKDPLILVHVVPGVAITTMCSLTSSSLIFPNRKMTHYSVSYGVYYIRDQRKRGPHPAPGAHILAPPSLLPAPPMVKFFCSSVSGLLKGRRNRVFCCFVVFFNFQVFFYFSITFDDSVLVPGVQHND